MSIQMKENYLYKCCYKFTNVTFLVGAFLFLGLGIAFHLDIITSPKSPQQMQSSDVDKHERWEWKSADDIGAHEQEQLQGFLKNVKVSDNPKKVDIAPPKFQLTTYSDMDNYMNEIFPTTPSHPAPEFEPEQRQIVVPKTHQKIKTILFWNKLFHSADFRFGLGQMPFRANKCKVDACRTTSDKTLLSVADVVMFHGPNIAQFPPPMRPPNQLYSYIQLEPHVELSALSMGNYSRSMNITVAHRKDADIWHPYGKIIHSSSPMQGKVNVDPRKKPRSLVWMVSHCNTTAKREIYVRELMKYIDVDIYGKCGSLSCPKGKGLKCYLDFEQKYKFILALENNNCRDYATEKLYRALEFKIIPIVFGGANYSDLAPPNSVINIIDHPKPKDLAEYLKYLGNNPKEYNKFFEWKSQYVIYRSRKKLMGDVFCDLCEIIHDPGYQYQDFSDLAKWWLNGTCESMILRHMRQQHKW